MLRGDKSSYTDKQKRRAEHIKEGYKERGLSDEEAARRAWATVNAMDHGGKKSGSGRGKSTNLRPAKKGGKKGGQKRGSRRCGPFASSTVGFREEGRRHAETPQSNQEFVTDRHRRFNRC